MLKSELTKTKVFLDEAYKLYETPIYCTLAVTIQNILFYNCPAREIKERYYPFIKAIVDMEGKHNHIIQAAWLVIDCAVAGEMIMEDEEYNQIANIEE